MLIWITARCSVVSRAHHLREGRRTRERHRLGTGDVDLGALHVELRIGVTQDAVQGCPQ